MEENRKQGSVLAGDRLRLVVSLPAFINALPNQAQTAEEEPRSRCESAISGNSAPPLSPIRRWEIRGKPAGCPSMGQGLMGGGALVTAGGGRQLSGLLPQIFLASRRRASRVAAAHVVFAFIRPFPLPFAVGFCARQRLGANLPLMSPSLATHQPRLEREPRG